MSLADSFLADLEDIEGGEPVKAEEVLEEDVPAYSSNVLTNPQFEDFMYRIGTERMEETGIGSVMVRSSEDFVLISKANNFLPLIDAEVYSIYKFVAERFSKRFPELEQIVLMPIDYIRVVGRLQCSPEIASADLSFLPTNLVVAITVTASTSSGITRLTASDSSAINSRITAGIKLGECKKNIVEFLCAKMPRFAPNLNALIGSQLAAQLIAAAGGIESLATMPSQNIEAVGAHKQGHSGLSSAFQQAKLSLISQSSIVQGCNDPDLRKRALRLVLGKTAIAARVDHFNKQDRIGITGAKLRDEIEESLRKAAEPGAARTVKPLTLPDDKPKQRRGGKRLRKWKEKYGMSEIQKQASRLEFGSAQGDLEVNGVTVGKNAGMVRAEVGGGRIRRKQVKKQKLASKTEPGKQDMLAFTASGIHIPAAAPTALSSSSNDVFSSLSFYK